VRIIIEANADTAAETATNWIAELVNRKPATVLGLATGGTPVPVYQRLIARHQQNKLDFSAATTFNLDEYIGLELSHPESYHQFMWRHFFSRVNLRPDYCHLPDPTAGSLLAECERYEAAIAGAGGIDLQLLGIGRDGHIGFNEPGSSLASRTRVKHLTQQTIDDNARFFESVAQVPRLAITMGIETILDSRCCLLLATGHSKAIAIKATVEGPITASVPATALQLHQNCVIVIDEDAASLLERKAYYQMSEAAQRDLTASIG
jgi:glucosamine-6-phosphate deaminase